MSHFDEIMVVLNTRQNLAFKLVCDGHNVVVLGQAGTGKSSLIREMQSHLKSMGKSVSVVASTGIASTQFTNAKTLHSWGGLQDGHLSNDECLQKLTSHTVNVIKETDVLIADEMSMTSAKVFEQLEFVCRSVRGGNICFGGLQIVCVGDWFQIPPVANKSCNDPGKHCFTSKIWKSVMKHKVELTEVLRQTDIELIKAVNELERGTPTSATNLFLKKLARPLTPGDKPTVLYGTNFDVDWHNAAEINQLPGLGKTYKSVDTGNVKKLNSITAKKTLFLKVDCPVILVKNVSKGFVNGLQGLVTELEEDGPTVKFPNGTLKLTRDTFSVFNVDQNSNEAQRCQFPIAPSFAITIHKAQGLTIPRLVVNCNHIFSPGQVGVAIGRAVDTEGLQVLHYSPECSKKHTDEVYDFFTEPGIPVNEDISCCHDIPFVAGDAAVHIAFPDDDDFDDDDLQKIARWEDEVEHDIQHQPAVSETSNSEHGEAYNKYTVEEVIKIVNSFKCDLTMTSEQKMMNESIDVIIQFPEKLKLFFDMQFKKLTDLKGEGKGTLVKEETAFLQKYHSHLKSEFYQTSCRELFSPIPVYKLLAGRMMTYVRKSVEDEAKSTNIQEELTPRQVDIPESGNSKIRYVGGYAVAKVKNKYMNLVRSALSSYTVLDTSSKAKVDLLQSMVVPHAEVINSTKYPASLTEVSRKQNLTFGLSNISAEVFEFFMSVERKRVPLYEDKYLQRYKSELLQYVHTTVKSDKDLLEQFCKLFQELGITWLHTLRMDTPDEAEEVIHYMAQGSVILVELYGEIIDKYLSVTDAEYRRNLLAERGRKKTMEHRKQVILHQSSKASSSLLSMSTLQQDETPGCASSHWKPKGAVMQDRKQLSSFTKDELLHLGNAYGVKLNKVKKKDMLIESLSERILAAECMTHPNM